MQELKNQTTNSESSQARRKYTQKLSPYLQMKNLQNMCGDSSQSCRRSTEEAKVLAFAHVSGSEKSQATFSHVEIPHFLPSPDPLPGRLVNPFFNGDSVDHFLFVAAFDVVAFFEAGHELVKAREGFCSRRLA